MASTTPTLHASPNPVDEGAKLTVKIADGPASQEVTITFTDSGGGQAKSNIDTDADGNGETCIEVPMGWDDILISGGGANSISVLVN